MLSKLSHGASSELLTIGSGLLRRRSHVVQLLGMILVLLAGFARRVGLRLISMVGGACAAFIQQRRVDVLILIRGHIRRAFSLRAFALLFLLIFTGSLIRICTAFCFLRRLLFHQRLLRARLVDFSVLQLPLLISAGLDSEFLDSFAFQDVEGNLFTRCSNFGHLCDPTFARQSFVYSVLLAFLASSLHDCSGYTDAVKLDSFVDCQHNSCVCRLRGLLGREACTDFPIHRSLPCIVKLDLLGVE